MLKRKLWGKKVRDMEDMYYYLYLEKNIGYGVYIEFNWKEID